MQKIILPIDTKSLFLNIFNDNESGHTPTVSTSIKQGHSLNEKLSQIYKIPKQINFQNNHELVNELLKNSKSTTKINNVFVFDKISVNGIKLNCKSSFCLFIKEEIDPSKVQFGRIKLHYPMNLKYDDVNLRIDNKDILNHISDLLFSNAFIVNSFQYDFDSDYFNFKVTIIGENKIPYSKVFINNKGTGNKFNGIFNEYADSYDMEIINLKKKYGNVVEPGTYEQFIDNEKNIANEICMNYLSNKYENVRNITNEYSYSIYDFDYEENGITKYIMLYFTSTSIKYFNISSKRLKLLNDMSDKVSIMLITEIEDIPKINILTFDDLIKYNSSINSVMMKEV